MRQGRGSAFSHIAVLVVSLSMFLKGTLAAQYVVGGELSKWSFLHSNSKLSFYNDWAKNITLKTGDSLRMSLNCNPPFALFLVILTALMY